MVLMEKILYKKDSKGKIRQWRGYVDTIKEAQDTLVILPMLALDFNKRGHDVSYPAYGQRKFDGVRCMSSINSDGSVSLKSRKGKEFPHMNHLRQQIASLKGIPDGAFLDGELYSDTLTFQEVVGLVRRETLKPGDEDKLKQISLRLYDMLDPDDRKAGFEKRYNVVKKILGSKPPKNLILTENFELDSKDDMSMSIRQQVAPQAHPDALQLVKKSLAIPHKVLSLKPRLIRHGWLGFPI